MKTTNHGKPGIEVKGKIKTKYADLTDHGLLYEEDKDDQLPGKIQHRTGKAKQEIKDWIESL